MTNKYCCCCCYHSRNYCASIQYEICSPYT